MHSRPTRRPLMIVLLFGVALLLIYVGVNAYQNIAPSAACSLPATGPAQPGTSTRILASGGRQRCYILHVPPGYDPARLTPVVITLHGFAQNPHNQQSMSGWDAIADAESFIVVYPQGTSFPLRWNSSQTFNAANVDDVQAIRDVIADLAAIANVDPARIYVNGMSNGGGMTNRIACEMADTVAAVGDVAGPNVPLPDGCNPSRPIPVMGFYGAADPLVAYDGVTPPPASEAPQPTFLARLLNLSSHPASYPSAPAWAEGWAELNGCTLAPETIPPTGDVSGIHYTNCQDGADVILYTIDGGGHQWPGSAEIPFLGKASADINAAQVMWEFFKAHPLPDGS